MAEISGFFNSVNKDRIYDASDIARFLKKFFTNGVFNNSLQIKSNNNMSVSVGIGQANIEGYSYELTEELVLDITDSDATLSRIDSVILRLDLANRQITAQILQGNYATNPSQPNLTRSDNIYDLRLANILINSGTVRITQNLISDTRFNLNDCGNVVGAVNQIDTTDIFKQYQEIFNNWFSKVQDELSENQAGNLQNQINDIKNELLENPPSDLQNQINDAKDEISEMKSNCLTAYLNSKFTYTSNTTAKKMPLTLNTVKGTKLSMTEDGGIKIGSGVDKILVNGQVYFYTGATHNDGKITYIYKNDASIGRGGTRDNNNYLTVTAGPFIVDVQEGDVFYLYALNDANISTVIQEGRGNTFLNVLVI